MQIKNVPKTSPLCANSRICDPRRIGLDDRDTMTPVYWRTQTRSHGVCWTLNRIKASCPCASVAMGNIDMPHINIVYIFRTPRWGGGVHFNFLTYHILSPPSPLPTGLHIIKSRVGMYYGHHNISTVLCAIQPFLHINTHLKSK